MEKSKRANCYCCGRHRYTKYMTLTPLANANNQWSYVCKENNCETELKKQLQSFVKLWNKKLSEATELLKALEEKSKKNVKQLTID